MFAGSTGPDARWVALSHAGGGAAVSGPPPFLSPADLLARAPASPPPPAERVAPGAPGETADGLFFVHTVTPRDTLDGLSLRYGVNSDAIKAANDLATNNLAVVTTLRIPRGRVLRAPAQLAGDSRAATLRAFCHRHKLGEPEALYYLESHGFDAARAGEEAARDAAFARDNPGAEDAAAAAAAASGAGRPFRASAPQRYAAERAGGAAGGGAAGGGAAGGGAAGCGESEGGGEGEGDALLAGPADAGSNARGLRKRGVASI